MDTALRVGSEESLQNLLGAFFEGQYCDIGLWCKPGDGVMGLVERAAGDKEFFVLSAGMTQDEVCFWLAHDEPEFVVVDAPLWESQWGRVLLRGLSECVSPKDLGGFKLKVKVLFLFPFVPVGDTAVGPDFPDMMDSVADKLLCVVYDPPR